MKNGFVSFAKWRAKSRINEWSPWKWAVAFINNRRNLHICTKNVSNSFPSVPFSSCVVRPIRSLPFSRPQSPLKVARRRGTQKNGARNCTLWIEMRSKRKGKHTHLKRHPQFHALFCHLILWMQCECCFLFRYSKLRREVNMKDCPMYMMGKMSATKRKANEKKNIRKKQRLQWNKNNNNRDTKS